MAKVPVFAVPTDEADGVTAKHFCECLGGTMKWKDPVNAMSK